MEGLCSLPGSRKVHFPPLFPHPPPLMIPLLPRPSPFLNSVHFHSQDTSHPSGPSSPATPCLGPQVKPPQGPLQQEPSVTLISQGRAQWSLRRWPHPGPGLHTETRGTPRSAHGSRRPVPRTPRLGCTLPPPCSASHAGALPKSLGLESGPSSLPPSSMPQRPLIKARRKVNRFPGSTAVRKD